MQRILKLTCTLSVCLLLLSGCMGGEGTKKTPEAKIETTRLHLSHGVSVDMPKDWHVMNALSEDMAPTAKIKEHVKKGESIALLQASHNNDKGEKDGIFLIGVCNQTKSFPQKQQITQMSAEEFAARGESVREYHNAQAPADGSQDIIKSWEISLTQLNGKTTIMQRGYVVNPKEEKNAQVYQVYLEEPAGLFIEVLSDAKSADLTNAISHMLNSITIAE